MNHYCTPLFTALMQHAASEPVQFHIPGHKRGAGADSQFRKFIGDNALSIDLINIVPLDDLHQPSGVILEAERLAADAFGAEHTLFSVQGTTGAIITMIMSVCSPGDRIILPRNAHKSIMSAVILAGAVPIWVNPEKDDRLGIDLGVTICSVRKALEENPSAKAVLLINPTYYGTSVNLLEMVALIHSHGIPVLVDEAHGTLLHFHDDLPMSAMQAGADMAATSVHKLGGSMTQSSILNVQGDLVDIRRVRTFMSMLTTTSTSYLLLGSLDTARRQLALHGTTLAERTIRLAAETRRRINDIPDMYCFGEEICDEAGVFGYDPTKLCIHLGGLDITGFAAERWLREHYNIEVELSDLNNILCLVTLGDTERETDILVKALRHLSETFKRRGNKMHHESAIPGLSSFALAPREAFYAPAENVDLGDACGRIISEFVYVYPPGIPILVPGQLITKEIVGYIMQHIEVGLPVKGPEDPEIKRLRVVALTEPSADEN